jgi:CelD/BcsL family acetyltransferase involved in cellulose biosynthesis
MAVDFEVVPFASISTELRAAWTTWAARPGATPFSSPAFFDAWTTAFAAERSGFVVIGTRTRDALPVLALPMWHARDRPDDWRSLAELRADYTEAYAPVDDPEIGTAFWRWLELRAPCRSAKVSRIPIDTLLGRTVPARSRERRGRMIGAALNLVRTRSPRFLRTTEQTEHPYADREKIVAMAERLQSQKSRRNLKLLERSGAVSYRVVRGAAITPLLPSLFDMHISNFAGTGRASQFESPTERAFYTALVAHPDLASSVCMDVLSVGDQHAALHLGFDHGGVMYWYKPAFALEHAKASPGRSMLAYVYERARAQGTTRFDLLKGAEGYKDEWANAVRATVTTTLVRPRAADLLARVRRGLR